MCLWLMMLKMKRTKNGMKRMNRGFDFHFHFHFHCLVYVLPYNLKFSSKKSRNHCVKNSKSRTIRNDSSRVVLIKIKLPKQNAEFVEIYSGTVLYHHHYLTYYERTPRKIWFLSMWIFTKQKYLLFEMINPNSFFLAFPNILRLPQKTLTYCNRECSHWW